MLCVIATIEVREGGRERFLEIFGALVPSVLREEGCIAYAPLVDLPTTIAAQIPLRPNVVTIVEKWEGIEALEEHLVAPHMLEYRKAVKDLVSSVTLQILQPAVSTSRHAG